MILLRSEPQGAAFRELLDLGRSRHLGVGFAIDGEVPQIWQSALSAPDALVSTRNLLGSQSIDPQTIAFASLTDNSADYVFEMFDGELFGYKTGGRTGADSRAWARDLFIARDLGDARPLLRTVSSEMSASLSLTADEWAELPQAWPILAPLPINFNRVSFLEGQYASDVVFEIWEAESESDCLRRLAEPLQTPATSYEDCERALAAASLVLSALAPATVGDIGWRLVGQRAPVAPELQGLLNDMVGAIDAITSIREWRHHWSGQHLLPFATMEVEWMLRVARSLG